MIGVRIGNGRAFRIDGRDGADRQCVLVMRQIHIIKTTIGGDLGCLVDDDIDRELLLVGAALAVTRFDDQQIDVIEVGIVG